jgi:hypothetical protein
MFSHAEKSISIFISLPGKEMTYYADSCIVVGVRSTEVHYDDTIPVVQDQPDDQCVDSSTVELEQSNAEYDLTEVVDSSAEELELSNTEYIRYRC